MAHVTTRTSTWIMLLMLLTIHLTTNYLAVRSVVLLTLNRQRTNIVYSHYRAKGVVLTPFQASRLERIFDRGGVLRDTVSGARLGHVHLCSSFGEFVRLSGPTFADKRRWTKEDTDADAPAGVRSIARIFSAFQSERYILCPCPDTSNVRNHQVLICLKEYAKPEDHLKAWIHAYECLSLYEQEPGAYLNNAPLEDAIRILRNSLRAAENNFPSFVSGLQEKGWDTTISSILTKPVRGVQVDMEDRQQSPADKFTH